MEVLSIRPAVGTKTLAYFDLAIGDHLRLYNLQLRTTPGGPRIVAPKACGKHAATFHPALAEQITRAAVAALGGPTADDQRAA